MMREGIRRCLENYPGLDIAGEAGDGEEALRKTKESPVDVVLMDIAMPRMGGLEATRLMRHQVPDTRVLILTTHEQADFVRDVIEAGASGYVVKTVAVEELVQAITVVAGGKAYFSPQMTQAALEFYAAKANGTTCAKSSADLSEREWEVLKLVAQGSSTKQIAASMGITHRTVETYRERMMQKLDIHNVAGLTRFAVAHGIVGLD